MAGHSTGKKKLRINPKAFKNAFSFKQNPQSSHSHQATAGGAATYDIHHQNKRHKGDSPKAVGGYGTPQYDDDSSTCSSTFETEGLLVFPTAQRLTASCPPAAILDGIPGLKNSSGKPPKGMNLRRSSSARRASNYLSSSSPPALLLQSPYQSKKAQRNLPPTLKNCRKTSAKRSIEHTSAWERRQPLDTTSRRANKSMSGGISIMEDREAFFSSDNTAEARLEMLRAESSDSLFILPPEVSPANKFVPIGCEEDFEDDDLSFNSQDYDICKVPLSELAAQAPPIVVAKPAATVAVGPQATKKSNQGKKTKSSAKKRHPSPLDSDKGDEVLDKYSSWEEEEDKAKYNKAKTSSSRGVFDLPPSPVATDDYSCDSYGLLRGMSPMNDPCSDNDKYCVGFVDEDSWVGRLSSYFVSNCGT